MAVKVSKEEFASMSLEVLGLTVVVAVVVVVPTTRWGVDVAEWKDDVEHDEEDDSSR